MTMPAALATRSLRWTALPAAVCMLAACTVGPNYVRPSAPTPRTYKEAQDWKPAQPKDHLDRGKWWQIFGDPQLDALERQIDISNQNLRAAEAQFRQARALVRQARAGYFPTLSASTSVTRAQSGGGSSRVGPSGATIGGPSAINEYSLALDASWELDVWGRVRRQVESNQASAQASAADLESVRLSAQAELAQDYLQLRILDAQKRLFDSSVAAFQESLRITQNRYTWGVSARADVAQAQTQLQSTQAQAIDTRVQRAQLEHAIASLIGKPPSDLSIPPAVIPAVLPEMPVGVPSQLLERRPDIAAAERRVAAANAQIGVAKAAYFPTLTLSASGGFLSSSFARWLTLPSRFWSLGPELAAPLFEGGLRRAQTEQAIAAYDQAVASYRQTVLGGFQEVEDNLAALRILEQEARVQDEAVKAARESVRITLNQYKAGIVSYLNVVIVQTTALSDERTALDILGRRLTAAVVLVRALGGGWSASELASAGQGATRVATVHYAMPRP